MTTPTTPQTASPTMTIRLIHGSFVVGVVLFAVLTHFIVRPGRANVPPLPANVLNVLLGASLLASVLGFVVFRPRVPRRSTDESADLYWATAVTPAFIAWAPLEGAGLLAVVAYMLGAGPMALGVAAIAVLGMLVLRPGYFENASSRD